MMSASFSIELDHSLPTQDAATFYIAQQNCSPNSLNFASSLCQSPQQFWLPPSVYLGQDILPSTLDLALDMSDSYVESDTAALRFKTQYVDNFDRLQYSASAEIWMTRGSFAGWRFPGTSCEVRISGLVRNYCYAKGQIGLQPVPSVTSYSEQFQGQQRRLVVVNAPYYRRVSPDGTGFFADPSLPDSGIAGSDQWTSFYAAYDEQVATSPEFLQILSYSLTLQNTVNQLVSESPTRLVVSTESSIDQGARPSLAGGGPPMQKWQDIPPQNGLPTWVTGLSAGSLTSRGYFLAQYETSSRAYAAAPSPSVSSVQFVMELP
jgi:hypothetical protein